MQQQTDELASCARQRMMLALTTGRRRDFDLDASATNHYDRHAHVASACPRAGCSVPAPHHARCLSRRTIHTTPPSAVIAQRVSRHNASTHCRAAAGATLTSCGRIWARGRGCGRARAAAAAGRPPPGAPPPPGPSCAPAQRRARPASSALSPPARRQSDSNPAGRGSVEVDESGSCVVGAADTTMARMRALHCKSRVAHAW
jgi:hypothetical protein